MAKQKAQNDPVQELRRAEKMFLEAGKIARRSLVLLAPRFAKIKDEASMQKFWRLSRMVDKARYDPMNFSRDVKRLLNHSRRS